MSPLGYKRIYRYKKQTIEYQTITTTATTTKTFKIRRKITDWNLE
jgi:hypothetical protein